MDFPAFFRTLTKKTHPKVKSHCLAQEYQGSFLGTL